MPGRSGILKVNMALLAAACLSAGLQLSCSRPAAPVAAPSEPSGGEAEQPMSPPRARTLNLEPTQERLAACMIEALRGAGFEALGPFQRSGSSSAFLTSGAVSIDLGVMPAEGGEDMTAAFGPQPGEAFGRQCPNLTVTWTNPQYPDLALMMVPSPFVSVKDPLWVFENQFVVTEEAYASCEAACESAGGLESPECRDGLVGTAESICETLRSATLAPCIEGR